MNENRPDATRIRRIIDLARTAVNQSSPDQAITLINSLALDGDEEGLERDWADSRLVLAEAYSSKDSPVAEALFEEAIESLEGLPEPATDLKIRAYEHFGDYLRCVAKRPSLARPQLEIAKQKAMDGGTEEDRARIQLKIELIDLTADQSPELENFRILKRVAKKKEATAALNNWPVGLTTRDRAHSTSKA